MEYHHVYFSSIGVLFFVIVPGKDWDYGITLGIHLGWLWGWGHWITNPIPINEKGWRRKVQTVILQNRPQWNAITMYQVPCIFLSKELYRTLLFKWNIPKLVSCYIKSYCDSLVRSLLEAFCLYILLFPNEFSLEASEKWINFLWRLLF